MGRSLHGSKTLVRISPGPPDIVPTIDLPTPDIFCDDEACEMEDIPPEAEDNHGPPSDKETPGDQEDPATPPPPKKRKRRVKKIIVAADLAAVL